MLVGSILSELTDLLTTLIGDYGLYAVFALMLIDAVLPAASEAVMVGDTAWDLQMAAAAGCAGVGVLTGGHSRALLEAERPAACLESVARLPAWLGLTDPR